MDRQGDEVHVTSEEARGGVTNHGVRYVLVISLALAIIVLSLIWIQGATSGAQHPPDNAATDTRAKADPL